MALRTKLIERLQICHPILLPPIGGSARIVTQAEAAPAGGFD